MLRCNIDPRAAGERCGRSLQIRGGICHGPQVSIFARLSIHSRRRLPGALLCGAILLAASLGSAASARDSLGIYAGWGAFRDPQVPRCYAIAMAEPSQRRRDYQPFASIGTWPARNLRAQLHIRLSRKIAPNSSITLRIWGGARFELAGGGGDAWARNRQMDAAIVAAMRSATRMSVTARDAVGNRFTDSYLLDGAATAMDAATLGCARLG